MEQTTFLLLYLFFSLLSGLLGAAGMALVMEGITRSNLTNANMLVALGSLLTKSTENAFRVGAVFHAVAGVFFASLYILAFMALGVGSLVATAFTGLGLGFLHGIVFSFMLMFAVADMHPLPEFKEANISLGVTHVAGHVAFGLIVGIVVGLSPLVSA